LDTNLIIETSINLFVLSSMYILVALGFAFLYNMLGILNFAHGAIYMIGGYIGYALIQGLGINQWIALLMSALIVGAFGVFLERFCFRPFVGDFNRIIMVTVAITVILQTSVNIIAGTKIQAIPAFVQGIFQKGPVSITYERIVTFAIGLILMGIIVWFVNRTRLGHQMQAIAQNRTGAALQGINIHRVSAFACGLGCFFAAIAGCLMGAYLSLTPFMGDSMLIKVLVLVMLAGAGSIGGIFATGFILGGLDSVLPIWIPGAGSAAVAVAIVIIIMFIRPQGFFGHET
jgi:branched-chain amino acid transport system permease protein